MSTWLQAPMGRLRVLAARVIQSVGWFGVAGLVLIVVAISLTTAGWFAQRAFVEAALARKGALPNTARAPLQSIAVVENAVPQPELPGRGYLALLLTQMEQAALRNGLAWPAADYRIVAATATQPASLEVRCTLKGSYPRLRTMLVQLMGSMPAFSLRQFALTRLNADVPDVEAKLVLAVFLADDGDAAPEPTSTEAKR